jgi:hypothetical protein
MDENQKKRFIYDNAKKEFSKKLFSSILNSETATRHFSLCVHFGAAKASSF